MKGYSFNIVNSTLTITAEFAKEAAKPNTAAYKLVNQLRHDFPEMKIVRRTHARPKKYKNRSGEEFSCNQFKNLRYENMEAFINALPDSEKYQEVYQKLRVLTKVNTNGYTPVRKWFQTQFPEYRNNPLFYVNNKVAVITDIEPFLEKEKEESKVS